MLFRLLGKLTWFVTKKTLRWIVFPIMISAAIGAALGALNERIREGGDEPNGRVRTVIRPEK